jgi:hypothetical protein
MIQNYCSNNSSSKAKPSKCTEQVYYEMIANGHSGDVFYEENELASTRHNSNSISKKPAHFSKDRRFSVPNSSADEEARDTRHGHDTKEELTHLEIINESLMATSTYMNINKSSFSLGDLDDRVRKPVNHLECYRKKIADTKNIFTKLIKTMHDSNNKPPFLERLINKNGYANINRINLESRSLRYFNDLFNTIIDMNWGYILLLFVVSFLLSWTFFALLWFTMPVDCVSNMTKSSFLDSFLFSIETQQTIGYGSKFIGKECWQGLVILMFQCCFGVILESLMGGIVFAKLSKPQNSTIFVKILVTANLANNNLYFRNRNVGIL